MRFIVLVCLVLMLTGCSVHTAGWETVEDFVPTATETNDSPLYAISVGLPDAALTDEAEGCRRYETGTLQVETSTFLASDVNSAVRHLSGYEAERLTILQTSRFDLPEYQFAWYSQTEEGGRLCRADLVMDGMNCYAVVCSAPEEAGEGSWTEARKVFAAFGLSPAESV